MEKSRKILAFTGIRSEYDLQYSIAKSLTEMENIEFQFLVFGAHLSEKFGKTIDYIIKDGFKICDMVETFPDDDSYSGKVKTISILLNKLAALFTNEKPDIILVAGDREEVITASIAATYFNIPICHIFGGDKTFPDELGDIDEQIRNATTKLAQLHFVIHDDHKERILKMGEEPWRVNNVGSPALDKYNLFNFPNISKLSDFFGISLLKKSYAVLIHHSLPNNIEESVFELNNILSAIQTSGITTFISYPNNDPGNTLIIDCINEYSKTNRNLIVYQNLPREYFIPLIQNSKFLIGNSSMGILECPFLQLPAINVGKRQQERLNAGNVIFCNSSKDSITNAINKVLNDEEFNSNLKSFKNFYGDGNSGFKIASILATIPLDNLLLAKKITY